MFPRALEETYNHLLLDDSEYATYLARVMSQTSYKENGNEGPFLLRRGLFSFLKADDYLRLFREAGFAVLRSQVRASQLLAERFRREFPERWQQMKDRRHLRDADLLAIGSYVCLRKECDCNGQGATPA